MKLDSIDKTNFTQLNFSKVKPADIGYVKDELTEIRKLADKYDITLKSDVVTLGIHDNYDVIKVNVSPQKDSLKFFKRFFRPKASMNFYTTKSPYPEAEGESLCDIIRQSIKYLNS